MGNLIKNFEEKPYNMCLNCAHIGKRCDGPNFLAMDMKRLSEWCRLRKDYLHNLDYKWTNEYIAEQADLSKGIVDKFLAGKSDDIRLSTLSGIIKVLVNGTWGQYPCAMDAIEKEVVTVDNPELVAECERLRAEIAKAKETETETVLFLKEQIKFKEEQTKQKDALLKERADYLRLKDRYLKWLTIILGLTVSIILLALIINFLNHSGGFFG